MNLATHLLLDGFRKEYQAAVLVANDSDLLEPVRIVSKELGLVVGILNPHRKASRVLALEASFVKQIRPAALQASQLPASLKDAHGVITKPAVW